MKKPAYLLSLFRGLVVVALATLTASAQQPQLRAPQQSQQPYTLSVSTQLVIETVVVKDKDGKPIEDLTAKDFIVTEDNVPQTISVFEFQKIQDEPVPVRQPVLVTPDTPVPAAVPEPVKQITPEKPGDIRYRDRRLIALYFEMSSMPDADKYRTLVAAQKYLSTQMRTADMVSVMAHTGGAVRILQDFTDNRDLL